MKCNRVSHLELLYLSGIVEREGFEHFQTGSLPPDQCPMETEWHSHFLGPQTVLEQLFKNMIAHAIHNEPPAFFLPMFFLVMVIVWAIDSVTFTFVFISA